MADMEKKEEGKKPEGKGGKDNININLDIIMGKGKPTGDPSGDTLEQEAAEAIDLINMVADEAEAGLKDGDPEDALRNIDKLISDALGKPKADEGDEQTMANPFEADKKEKKEEKPEKEDKKPNPFEFGKKPEKPEGEPEKEEEDDEQTFPG